MSNIDKMIEINKIQKEFYEVEDEAHQDERKSNFITRLWFGLRNKLIQFRVKSGIEEEINEIQKLWMGDLSDKKVLDLGCFSGNPLSLYLAKNSKEYLGLDLSESAIDILNKKLNEENLPNAKAISVDFLDKEFQTKYADYFDIIYAKSVIHHFKYFEDFLLKLKNVTKKDGLILTFDPMNTYWMIKLARAIYRPFQSDKDWEFPLTQESINLIQKHFDLQEIRGLVGKSKFTFLYMFLGDELAIKKGKIHNEYDVKNANKIGSALWNCLQVVFLLKNSKK